MVCQTVTARVRRDERQQHRYQVTQLEARLRARLGRDVWRALEREWSGRAAWDAHLPVQRRDFLIHKADQHDVDLAGIL